MRANECYRKCGRDETTKYYNMKSIIEKIEYRLKELNEKKKSIENETSFRVGKKLELVFNFADNKKNQGKEANFSESFVGPSCWWQEDLLFCFEALKSLPLQLPVTSAN